MAEEGSSSSMAEHDAHHEHGAGPATVDPTLYRSPAAAMTAPPEQLAYVALLDPDALGVVDLSPASPTYGRVLSVWEPPRRGEVDEFHHFGWNVCSSALGGAHAGHADLRRRYLILPGIRSSRIYILDTLTDPRKPELVHTVEPQEVFGRSGYSRPHTVHCGPEGLFVSALGAASDDGTGGPGGIFTMDHSSFAVGGQWEADRGDQVLAYDFWWHLDEGVLMASEWAPPPLFEHGVVPEALLGRKYGHRLHFFDLESRKRIDVVDLGDQHQMALEVRPAHDPAKSYGFCGVVIDVTNLASSIWTWFKEGGSWRARKVIEIPAVPADPSDLPPLLQAFSAVPPLVTDIDLSLDDRYLYVSCWGLGELRQYDVSDPFAPVQVGQIDLGGITRHRVHPSGRPFGGGPQMVEVSRDGKRIYFTNSLYSTWDPQFYPEGVPGVMVKADAAPGGGMTLDGDFYVEFPGHRAHQIRLQGGDCSTDSFCESS